MLLLCICNKKKLIWIMLNILATNQKVILFSDSNNVKSMANKLLAPRLPIKNPTEALHTGLECMLVKCCSHWAASIMCTWVDGDGTLTRFHLERWPLTSGSRRGQRCCARKPQGHLQQLRLGPGLARSKHKEKMGFWAVVANYCCPCNSTTHSWYFWAGWHQSQLVSSHITHGGCRWPSAYITPGNLQLSSWCNKR